MYIYVGFSVISFEISLSAFLTTHLHVCLSKLPVLLIIFFCSCCCCSVRLNDVITYTLAHLLQTSRFATDIEHYPPGVKGSLSYCGVVPGAASDYVPPPPFPLLFSAYLPIFLCHSLRHDSSQRTNAFFPFFPLVYYCYSARDTTCRWFSISYLPITWPKKKKHFPVVFSIWFFETISFN